MAYEIPFQQDQMNPYRTFSILKYAHKSNYEQSDNTDLVDRIFSDKSKSQKSVVKQLLNELELRRELHKNISLKIEDEGMELYNKILNLPKTNYVIEPTINRRKSNIESQITQLSQEKRQEELKYWEQMKELRTELMLAFNEYWLAFRKKEFLDINENENI